METDEGLVRRFEATSKAQSRYLYLLALALVLCFIIDANAYDTSSGDSGTVTIPGLDLRVGATVLWQLSPIVISVLVMAVLGAMQAATSAWEVIRSRRAFKDAVWEHLDAAPNLIDFAVFTTSRTPRLGQCLALLSYPAFLTFAWLESIRIILRVMSSPRGASHPGLLVASFTIVSIPVFWRLVLLWKKKLRAMQRVW